MLSTQDDAAWRPWRPGVNKSFVFTRGRVIWFRRHAVIGSEALTKQIGHLDEEGPPVAAEARFELAGKGTEAVAVDIVVVSNIEGRPRIRRPAKQKLPFEV